MGNNTVSSGFEGPWTRSLDLNRSHHAASTSTLKPWFLVDVSHAGLRTNVSLSLLCCMRASCWLRYPIPLELRFLRGFAGRGVGAC